MKKFAVFIFLICSCSFAQFNYPAEDFLGGGIGYSPMYVKLNGIPGSSSLDNFGLDTTQFDDPFVIHGGEGFAHITGRWRLGGYAGMGSSTVSTVPFAMIFLDLNENGKQDPGENTQKEYEGVYSMAIRAKFSFMLGIPTILGALVFLLLEIQTVDISYNFLNLIIGFLVSMFIAFFTIKYFLIFIEKIGMIPFVAYRVVLGIVLLLLF